MMSAWFIFEKNYEDLPKIDLINFNNHNNQCNTLFIYMKKCFYFSNWEEQKDVMISLDEKEIFTNCKPIYNDELILNQQVESNNFEINFKLYKQSTSIDPILVKLCEPAGAKVYGDYIVLKSKICLQNGENGLEEFELTAGDVLLLDATTNNAGTYILVDIDDCIDFNFDGRERCFYVKKEYNTHSCRISSEKNYILKNYIKFNAFEEYSLFLQGKENKWEEVKNVLGL